MPVACIGILKFRVSYRIIVRGPFVGREGVCGKECASSLLNKYYFYAANNHIMMVDEVDGDVG